MGSTHVGIANGTVALGWSNHPNALTAGETAGRMASHRMTDHRPRWAVVFASSWFDQPKLLEGLHRALPDVILVGGSSAGEILPDGPTSHSCVVLAVGDDGMEVASGLGVGADRDPRLAGHEAALQALKRFQGKSRSGFLLFGDGLVGGYTETLHGVQEVLGTQSVVAGGLMADDLRFTQTYQYADDQALSRSVVGLLLGSCAIGMGLEHGFEPISRPLRVTAAHANILQQLDGHPAMDVYEEYFGDEVMEHVHEKSFTRQLIAYPLGIQGETTDAFLLRNVREFSADGSVVCTGEIPEGATVRLMIGSKELALEAASRAAQTALRSLASVRFVLLFDSASRRALLGSDAAREIQQIRHIIGLSTPLIGCYTYGEHVLSTMQTGAALVIAVGE
ncbi:MAG: FIST C-terminal domain-containing protein [Candidatus Omnitrophica bacterium]|nr:FIST C-terminal domain-containing protein [Candidatus Omnitrophota bacterium]